MCRYNLAVWVAPQVNKLAKYRPEFDYRQSYIINLSYLSLQNAI
jgi:hypothetical protein